MEIMDIKDKRYYIYTHILSYKPFDKNEEHSRLKTLQLLETVENPFEFDSLPGHFAGSALVVDKSLTYTLLTHHQGLNLWLQLGGHSYGESNTIYVAFKKAYEESRLKRLEFLYPHVGIFDIDTHIIKANDRMTDHFHCDIRVLLVGSMDEKIPEMGNEEELKWVLLSEAHQYNTQPSFLRLIAKAISLKGAYSQ